MSKATDSLNFVKLVVDDFDASVEFYKKVFGQQEAARVEDKMNGRPMVEMIFAPEHEGGASLIIMKWLDGYAAGNNQAVIVMITDDVDACARRAADAGGKVTEAPNDRDGARVAFIEDLEGNLVEIAKITG